MRCEPEEKVQNSIHLFHIKKLKCKNSIKIKTNSIIPKKQ